MRLLRRVGKRGAALLCLACIELIYGSALLDPLAPEAASPGYRWLASVLPLQVWGGIWLFVGVLCLIGSVVHEDSVAWVAAMSIKVMWGLLWLLGWWLVDVPRGWRSAAVWLPMAAVVALLASWAEPGSRRRPMWTGRPRQH
ncbi:MAG: hypothetical protein JWO11_4438 [Nocardioides sp.]|nr:hypothetical protein [Nocardioides sp.]